MRFLCYHATIKADVSEGGEFSTMRRALLLVSTMTLMLLLAAGVALAVTTQCQAQVDCIGTKKADTLNGSSGFDLMFGRGRGDTLKGFGGSNSLFGQAGGDRLFGGPEFDYLIGGAGRDELDGAGGTNRYYFGPNWGIDSITDDTTSTDEIVFRSDPDGGVIVTDDVIIDLTPSAGPEVKTTSGTNRIDWEGTINYVITGVGDDHITGNASANIIGSYGGADTIFGGEGDDEIRVYDSDGSIDDTVHCGAGEDTVVYNVTGLLSDSIDSDCEHLAPTASI